LLQHRATTRNQHDVGPHGRQFQRDAPPYAARCAGDDEGLAGDALLVVRPEPARCAARQQQHR
jgi:hypothetical protein